MAPHRVFRRSPLAFVAFGLACAAGALEPPERALFRQSAAPPGARAADLVARMTPEEKRAELAGGIAPLPPRRDRMEAMQREAKGRSPHAIPLLFHAELFDPTLPGALALAATWDPELVRETAAAASARYRARGAHLVRVPLALARDPRLGRADHTFGEDPHLVAEMGVAAIAGIQGERSQVLAAAGPLAGPRAPLEGTDVQAAPIAERELREVYLPPFEEAVGRGRVRALVAARNEIDGMPSHANPWLLRDVVRGEWRYGGAVLADSGGIGDLRATYRVATDEGHATALALAAGIDGTLEAAAPSAIARDGVAQARIDTAVERTLALKFEAGLFDTAAKRGAPPADEPGLAERVARRSITLLANRGALPLALAPAGQAPRKIAVVDLAGSQLGATLRAKAAGRLEVVALEPAARAPSDATHIVLVAGDDLAQVERALEAQGPAGTPVVVVLAGSRPQASVVIAARANALVAAWSLGNFARDAIADVLLGEVNPGGKLPLTLSRNPGQWPMTYDAKPSWDRGYLFDTTEPLYPFGWGLTYSAFEVGAPRLSRATIGPAESVQVSIDVRNAGARAGDETVQVYVRDKVASVTRPVKALKAFRRVTLAPGQSRTLTFTLDPGAFALWNEGMRRVVELGEFEIMAGADSARLKSATLTVMAGR